MSRAAEIVAVCIGPGGLPNTQVESCAVSLDGLEGDRHRFHLHGGRDRAVCLLSVETYEALRDDDVECHEPGTFGENVLTRGLEDATLVAGDRLRLGEDLILEIHDIRAPCMTLKAVDPRFPELLVGRSGWVCRVVQPGILRRGAPIERLQANGRGMARPRTIRQDQRSCSATPLPTLQMSEFEVVSYTIEPVEGDSQVAITIHASDGNKWEYGVPYSPDTGRFTFEELDVLATDFGDDVAEEREEKLEEAVRKVTGGE